MSNNPLRKDYAGEGKPMSARGWMLFIATVFGITGFGLVSDGRAVGWVLLALAGLFGGAGLVGYAVRG